MQFEGSGLTKELYRTCSTLAADHMCKQLANSRKLVEAGAECYETNLGYCVSDQEIKENVVIETGECTCAFYQSMRLSGVHVFNASPLCPYLCLCLKEIYQFQRRMDPGQVEKNCD